MPTTKAKKYMKNAENEAPYESILGDESNTKMLKKEAFLRDYDIQVVERVKSMENELKKILADLTRMTTTEKLKISKEVRNMTIKEFLEKGGDLNMLDLKEISSSNLDVSFQRRSIVDATPSLLQTGAGLPATITRPVRQKGAPNPSLARDTLIRSSRAKIAKKTDVTPCHRGKRKLRGAQNLLTPMITPKFDISKPLTSAREPMHGETLVSLAGSPVVGNHGSFADNDSNLVSISLTAQQTVLGGRLFVDEGMSPNTLLQRKHVIEEAMGAINSRLEALNRQMELSS